MARRLLIFFIFSISLSAYAVPGEFVYQGQIIKPNGDKLEAASVIFTIDIYSPGSEECLLYTETHTVNMTDSKGLFAIPVGQGARSGGSYENVSQLIDVFDNNLPVQTPAICDSVGTYTPTNGDHRVVRVTFDEGSGPITVSQDHKVKSVPFAQHSNKLDGKDAVDFVNINNGAGQELTQANVENIFSTANHTELLTLLGGTSSQYMVSTPTSSPNFNNMVVEGVGNPVDPDDAANKNYVDNNIGGAGSDNATISNLGVPQTGHVLVWDGTEWTAATPALDTTKLATAGGTMTGNIDMGNNDITNIKDVAINNDLTVTNNVSITGGIGVGTGINSSGPILLTAQNELRLQDADGGEFVGLRAPTTVGSNQIWTLPSGDGTVGQALSTDGSGQLIWQSIASTDGVSGGQTLSGGTDAGDDFVIDSTSDATKGDVILQPDGGNVGVGTSSPSELLHIAGSDPTILLTDTDTNADSSISADNATGSLIISADENGEVANSSIVLATDGTDRVIIDDAGSVGIGTDNPSEKLHVQDGEILVTNSSGDAAVNIDRPATNNDSMVNFDTAGTNQWSVGMSGVLNTNDFTIQNSSGIDQFTILQSNGNIGIGSNNPTTALDVDGTVTATAFVGDGSGITGLGASALATGSVGSDELIDGSVSLADMNTDSVDSSKIVDGSVSLADLNTNSVDSSKLVDGSIVSADIAADTITAADIATGGVASAEILDGSVALADLAGNSVDSSKIVDGSITAADLADDYVNVSGDGMTGTLTMNARNEVRFADTAGGQYVGFRAPSTVSTNVTYSLPDADGAASGYVLATDASGNLSWNLPGAPADNMGNNVATAATNVQLNNNWLSNDGGNEGIRIDNSGNVGIGTTAPAVQLDVHTGAINAASICDENNANCLDLSAGVGAGAINDLSDATKTVDNLFVGHNGGSVGAADNYNTAFGIGALSSLDGSGGNYNTASGYRALYSNTTGDYNTASGIRALYSNTTGANNTASGVSALFSNTTGANNTASGMHALSSNTTGSYNTASGMLALFSNTTGANNTASGMRALYSNTTGANNTASGYKALNSNTTGFSNTASGMYALYSNTTGANNTASGYDALYSNTTGNSNTASGYDALYSNTTGFSNTASGSAALYSNTTGFSNTASGSAALYSNTTGANNTASGVQALYSNTEGNHNTASGYRALRSNTTGNYNTASGVHALYSNTTGNYNTASGNDALYSNTTGSHNTASGRFALYSNTTGVNNTASGMSALYSNTTGHQNTASGANALYSNTTGSHNTASGRFALYFNTTGNQNTASGRFALHSNTTGSDNTASGVQALYSNTTGNYNTASGNDALYSNTTGSNNTAIGYNTGIGITTGMNNTIIGARVTGLSSSLSNNVIIADGSGNRRINVDSSGNVGIGTTAPSYKLHVNGSVAGVGAYNNLSDKRLKRDIASLPNPLNNLLEIQGVTYDWRRNENPELDFPEGKDMGVIAQDVQAVFPEAIVEDDKGLLSVAYSKLIAPIIEAIRELKKRSDQQEVKSQEKEREISSLKANMKEKDKEIDDLKSRLETLEKIILEPHSK